MTPEALSAEYGDTAPAGDGRDDYMAALTVRTRSLERTAGTLAAGHIDRVRHESDRIVVPANEAFGVTLEFRE
jgi:hypothetical protein